MTPLPRVVLVLCCAAASAAQSAAADWAVDTARSLIGFIATYDRIPFETRFERYAANIRFEAARPAEGRIEVTIETASVNSRSPDRDDGMQGAEWFHAAKFPRARFVSRGIVPAGDGRYRLSGDLTIKGITRAIEIPIRWLEKERDAHLAGEINVKRTDFEVGTGDWEKDDTIGFEVKIVFDLLLRKK